MYLLLSIETATILTLILYWVNYFKLDKKIYIKMFIINLVSILLLANVNEKILMIFIIIFIYCFLRKKIGKINSLIMAIITYLIMFISDTLASIIIIKVLNMDITSVRENCISSLITFTITCVISYLIAAFMKKMLLKKIESIELMYKNKLILFIVLSLILTLLIFYINKVLFNNIDTEVEMQQVSLDIVVYLLYCLLLVLMFNFVNKVIKKEMELKINEASFENIKEYTKNLEALNSEMRRFKHDYVNILSSLQIYIDNSDIDGLRDYFNSYIVKYNSNSINKNNIISNLHNINIMPLKGLISSKLMIADTKGLKIYSEVSDPIDELGINIIDLCRILGILLDNAIEAAEQSDEKKVEIAIIKNIDNIMIAIQNSYPNDVPPIYKMFKKGFSTKGKDRGLGLTNIKEIVNKYNNVTLDTSIDDNKFKQILIFSY